ncbi:MAG: hypothetical protein MZW92_14080 [Comamonadaceae bacterium]|nr:hypothetical protein [Comamonadaceae bacterium]
MEVPLTKPVTVAGRHPDCSTSSWTIRRCPCAMRFSGSWAARSTSRISRAPTERVRTR